jgi:DNA/RNA endonuclease YhcR with UshA esterase domain
MKKIILLASIIALFTLRASAQTTIPAKDAAKHINEKVTICDKIWSTKLLDGSNMTFLDMGGYHPNQLLTIVIKGEDRGKFKGKPEDDYKGRAVCVTGTIIDFKGKPEIVVTDPDQLKLDMKDTPNMPPSAPSKF